MYQIFELNIQNQKSISFVHRQWQNQSYMKGMQTIWNLCIQYSGQWQSFQ